MPSTTDVTVTQTVDRRQIEQAAAIFYEAFRPKLDHLEFMTRTPAQAQRIMTESFRPELGFFAVRAGEVIGLAGTQIRGRAFLDVPFAIWRREFGLFGGLRRHLMRTIGALFTPVPADAVRVQGIAVAAAARGLGVGTLLLDHIDQYARDHGLAAVVLEVVDTNPDAQRLYERLGFRVIGTEHYGRLTAAGGFTGMTRMRKEIE